MKYPVNSFILKMPRRNTTDLICKKVQVHKPIDTP